MQKVAEAAILLGAAAVIGLGGTWAVRQVARRRAWVGYMSEHHSHEGEIPRLGGTVVFASLIVTTAIAMLMFGHGVTLRPAEVLGVIAGAACVFTVGLVDDFRRLPPHTKLVVQFIAGAIVYSCGPRVFNDAESVPLSLLVAGGTLFWVASITNAFNLIDGLDGLCGGLGLISAIALAVIAGANGHFGSMVLTLSMAGVLVGFLVFNFSPATIFLGDCGSLVIGCVLGSAALDILDSLPFATALLSALLIFGVPTLDIALAVVRRAVAGKPIFSPDCHHIHHKLLVAGFSVRQAVVILHSVAVVFASLGVTVAFGFVPLPAALVLAALFSGAFVMKLGYHHHLPIRRHGRTSARHISGEEIRMIRQDAEHSAESSADWSFDRLAHERRSTESALAGHD